MKPAHEHLAQNFNNPFVATTSASISTLTILSEQLKNEDLIDPLAQLANGATGNGYQKLPFRPHPLAETDAVDYHLTSRLNRMYTQSPQLPRKTYDFNPNMNNIHPSPQLQHHIGQQSPYMQRKFPPNEIDYGNHYSPYKPLPPQQQQQQPSTFSPVIRKRYQEGHLVSEDLEFRILHGNTSPIVLQRFYHQQNQLKDQKEEDQLRAIRMQSASPNPFKSAQSCIPVKSGGSPLPSSRYQHQPAQMMHRNIVHHNEPTYNASHRIYESQIPQLQSRMMANGNGQVPYRHHQPQHQPMYDNIAHRAQIACPSSPQLDRLRMNLEKQNFYERHQKLPAEIESSYQLEMSMNQNQNAGSFIGDKNKDKGKRYGCFINVVTIAMSTLNPLLTILTLFWEIFVIDVMLMFDRLRIEWENGKFFEFLQKNLVWCSIFLKALENS